MKIIKSLLCAVVVAFMAVSCAGSGVEKEVGHGAPRAVTDIETGNVRGAVHSVLYGENELKVVYNRQGYIAELHTSRLALERVLRLATKLSYIEDGSTLKSVEEFDYSWDGSVSSRVTEDHTTSAERAKAQEVEGVVYQYDNNGYLIRTVEYKDMGSDARKFVDIYRYDDENRVSEYEVQLFVCDQADRKNEVVDGFFDLTQEKYEYYDMRITKYEYNKQGDPIAEVTFKPDGEEVKRYDYEYTYDNRGNWLTKKGGISATQVITREIVYY